MGTRQVKLFGTALCEAVLAYAVVFVRWVKRLPHVQNILPPIAKFLAGRGVGQIETDLSAALFCENLVAVNSDAGRGQRGGHHGTGNVPLGFVLALGTQCVDAESMALIAWSEVGRNPTHGCARDKSRSKLRHRPTRIMQASSAKGSFASSIAHGSTPKSPSRSGNATDETRYRSLLSQSTTSKKPLAKSITRSMV